MYSVRRRVGKLIPSSRGGDIECCVCVELSALRVVVELQSGIWSHCSSFGSGNRPSTLLTPTVSTEISSVTIQ